ncbi:PREDICTED: beta-1,3-galactosyltransferase 6-like [Amphimedon queenslandica]|uniref:Hexosyltransferase n=1 Tax=Amphimedon queenslandica TaxID=400682 RepID=A0A1X7UGI5_AMPQE|nr:PREDICTED: beta-1,3-galactosyltransferase 6-like [Amphimedon queenslandica]|eukprot:XP_011405102.1 PREDICTED: beta-1,3-galactosyltransferase 6-like [Amphimedon queenslandica]
MASNRTLYWSLFLSLLVSLGSSITIKKQDKNSAYYKYTKIRHIEGIPSCITDLDQLDEKDSITHHIHTNNVTLKLLVLVESTKGEEWRMGIRETWGSHASLGEETLLLFAVREGHSSLLMNESKEHKDMIIFNRVSSSHPKSSCLVHYLYWVQKLFNFSFLLRTHDKYFVKPREIMSLIHSHNQFDLELYLGYFRGNKEIEGSDSSSWFHCPSYAVHADDGGYILSSGLIERFLKAKSYLYYYNNEGASIGLWCSPFKDIKFVHDTGFDTSLERSRGCLNSYSITPVASLAQMREMYSVYRMNGQAYCTKEYENEHTYHYNWSALPSKCCQEKIHGKKL